METQKKNILYFEDEPNLLSRFLEKLSSRYEVSVGANAELIERIRPQPVDLLILDIMIHRQSWYDDKSEVQNISFLGVNWKLTGLEFLKRIRSGEYNKFGILDTVPVIVATVTVEDSTRKAIENLGIRAYILKPFSMEELMGSVIAVLG